MSWIPVLSFETELRCNLASSANDKLQSSSSVTVNFNGAFNSCCLVNFGILNFLELKLSLKFNTGILKPGLLL